MTTVWAGRPFQIVSLIPEELGSWHPDASHCHEDLGRPGSSPDSSQCASVVPADSPAQGPGGQLLAPRRGTPRTPGMPSDWPHLSQEFHSLYSDQLGVSA